MMDATLLYCAKAAGLVSLAFLVWYFTRGGR